MYTAKGQLDLNSTLKQYSGLVRRLAHQMIAKLPANVEIDDLIQVGMIGLTDALSRFDAAQGVQFETFATQRIRGAMLDELRGSDYLSRGTRKHQRSIESAVAKLEQQLGRAPQESEIAKEMGIGLAEYQELLGKVRGTQLVYLEDMSGAEGDSDFLDRYRDAAEFKACDLKRYSERVAELRARTVTPGNMENAVIPLPTSRPDLGTVSDIPSSSARGAEANTTSSIARSEAVAPSDAKPVCIVGPAFFPAN